MLDDYSVSVGAYTAKKCQNSLISTTIDLSRIASCKGKYYASRSKYHFRSSSTVRALPWNPGIKVGIVSLPNIGEYRYPEFQATHPLPLTFDSYSPSSSFLFIILCFIS